MAKISYKMEWKIGASVKSIEITDDKFKLQDYSSDMEITESIELDRHQMRILTQLLDLWMAEQP